MKRMKALASAIIAAELCACGSLTQGNAQLPNVNTVPLAGLGKATFAVGTARLQDGTLGLNVVAYLRQGDGLTAYLVDSPSIAGPSTFVIPTNTVTASNSDAGSNTISSTPQNTTKATTFGTYGGLYGGGIGPFNTVNGASNFYPGQAAPGGPSPAFSIPIYGVGTGAAAPANLIIGPPAVPSFTSGDYPTGFAGYLPGFLAFEATPVSGAYTLTVTVPAVNTASTTITASANLNAGTALGAIPAPTLTEDGKGGGTVSAVAAAGATESLIFVTESASSTLYNTVGPISGSGAISGTIPDGTLASGKNYSITVVSFDYPDFEATQPGNKQQTPTVVGTAGQCDVSISPATSGTY